MHHHDHDHEHHHDHDHEHHHHHHADEVFTSMGGETAKRFTKEEVGHILAELDNTEEYGVILRAKGILPAADGSWIHFDYVPEEQSVRSGSADYTGRYCVIGTKLCEDKINKLFSK